MTQKGQLHTKYQHLFIEAKVDEYKGRLIEDIENLDLINVTDEIEESQLRNVINVANSTRTVAVVTNFIKYQIGRKKQRNKGWRYNDFGENLIQTLQGSVKEWAEEISRMASQAIKGVKNVEDLQREVWCRLVRLYLGYLYRHYKYVQKPQGGSA